MVAVQEQINALQQQLDDLVAQLPGAVAEGLRVAASVPASQKGSPSLRFGLVDAVFEDDGYATVVLDGETNPVPINMLGGLIEDERVAVLEYPPSGNLALGMVTPAVVGSLPPGGTAAQVLTKIDATDGNADWETPTGGSGFPVGPHDDGTATYEIVTGAGGTLGELFITNIADAGHGKAIDAYAAGASGGHNYGARLIGAYSNATSGNEKAELFLESNATVVAVASLHATNAAGNIAFIELEVDSAGATGGILLGSGGPIVLSIEIGAAADQLGFFGTAPVGQQSTPVDVADVIALLQAYGLCP